METFNYYYYYLSSSFAGFPLVVKIAVFLITIMGIFYLMSWIRIGAMAYHTNRETKREKYIKSLRDRMLVVLRNQRAMTEDEILSELDIKPPIKNWMKEYISKLLVEEIEHPETNETNLKTTFQAIRIPEYWESQMESADVSRKWKSIRMLDNMSNYAAPAVISKKANSEKKDLGNYAKSVFAKFDSHNAFRFLEEESDHQFTQLDKMRIHNSLKKRPAEEVLPHLITTAINTSNDEYRTFLIHEIGMRGISTGMEPILELYKVSKNSGVKAQIVQTLSLLNYTPAIPIFIKDYSFSKLNVQKEIIEGLGCMGSKETLEFLEKAYFQTNNKEMLVKILRNIYSIESLGSGTPVFKRLKSHNQSEFNGKAFTYIESEYI